MALFFIFFFPILLYLGAWQVQRGIEKNAMWDLHDLNKSLPPMEETEMSLLAKEKRDYRNITLTGKYLPKTYFLDNRIYRQTAGYEVFSAFNKIHHNATKRMETWTCSWFLTACPCI